MAEGWLSENIPLIDIPDKLLEEIYYFRWWVFRKHIKSTPDGLVITEFLPTVYWGGTHNTIIAAAGHHISEARWLKCGKRIIEDYLKLWFEEKSKTYHYSSWIIYSLYEYCMRTGDFSFGIDNLSLLMKYYDKIEAEHMTKCGLMWSIDNADAMECSISGKNNPKGIRPTLNSYMSANAFAKYRLKSSQLIASENTSVDVEIVSNENYPIEATQYIKENLDLSEIKLFNEYKKVFIGILC